MADIRDARSRFSRWTIGNTPRIWAGVAWCYIGLAWFLLAAFGEGTLLRILSGSVFLVLGILQSTAALRDRKNGRGFYQPTAPDRHRDESTHTP